MATEADLSRLENFFGAYFQEGWHCDAENSATSKLCHPEAPPPRNLETLNPFTRSPPPVPLSLSESLSHRSPQIPSAILPAHVHETHTIQLASPLLLARRLLWPPPPLSLRVSTIPSSATRPRPSTPRAPLPACSSPRPAKPT